MLRLPLELRIDIFELVLDDTTVIRARPLGTSEKSLDFRRALPGFITACRQIYHDSKPLLSKHTILEVLSSRYFIRVAKLKSHHVRKLKIYSDATQEIWWRSMELSLDQHCKSFIEAEWDPYLLHNSFPALETIEIPGNWKNRSFENAFQYWFNRPDIQVTYHWDLEPELDLED